MSISIGKKRLACAALALAGTLAAGAAQAGTHVQWSIGINAPIAPGVALGTVISNGQDYYSQPYYPAPVYVQPAPVVYALAPYYVAPQPVYVRPAPRYWHERPAFVGRPVYGQAVPVMVRGGASGWRGGDHEWRGRRDHDRGYGPIARDDGRHGRHD